MDQEAKSPLAFPRWHDEQWADRLVHDWRQAAYAVGRIANCFRFHAEQAFLFSLTGAATNDVEHERRQAHQALLRLGDLIGRLRFVEPQESSVNDIRHRFSQKEADWRDDPVSAFTVDHAHGLKTSAEENGIELSAEALHEEILDSTTTVELDEEIELIHQKVTPRSRALIELGSKLDTVVRPLNIYPCLFEIITLPNPQKGGAEPAPTNDAVDDTQSVGFISQKSRTARHRVSGELPPHDLWRLTVREALEASTVDVSVTNQEPASHEVKSGFASQVEQIDAAIWAAVNPTLPYWDLLNRRLTYLDQVVKDLHTQPKMKQGMPSQELILQTFQKLGWPEQIDVAALGIDLSSAEKKEHLTKIVYAINEVRSSKTAAPDRKIAGIEFYPSHGGTVIGWRTKHKSAKS